MATPQAGSKLVAVLWFVAAALAFIAIGIRYTSEREVRWPVVVGGIFALVMGIAAIAQRRKPPPA